MIKRLASLAFALVAVTSCSDSTAPVSGQAFALKSVGTQPLPVFGWTAQDFTAYLVGDTLRFNADGTGAETVVFRFESNMLMEESGQTERYTFGWAQSGSNIQITMNCPDLAICAAPPHYIGSVGADGSFTITGGTALTGDPKHFARQ